MLSFVLFAFLSMLLASHGFGLLPRTQLARLHSRNRLSTYAVGELSGISQLDDIVNANKDKLVVIDYSMTWCGPCKLMYPKFVELSDQYSNVIFLKCIGDTSADTTALMKREGIRAVPSFHFWKNQARQEVINGAKIEDVEATIKAWQ